MSQIHIGNNIKVLRNKLDKNQAAIAFDIGKTYQTISNWEKEISFPSIEEIIKLSNIFGISIDDLILTDLSKEGAKHLAVKYINEDWKDKYYALMDKYNACLEGKNDKGLQQKTS